MGQVAKLDQIADQFAEQYRGLLTSIVGHFARALDSHDPTTPKARSDFRQSILRSSVAFLDGMVGQIEAHTIEVRNDALSTVGHALSDPDLESLNEYLRDAMDDLYASLYACLHRDDTAAERELRNFAHKVNLTQAATGMSKIGALIKTKFGRVSGLNFVQVDRLGRKRASEGFVRSLVRHHLVQTHVECQMFSIAKSGNDLAQIVIDNKPGAVISITGTTAGYPSYEEIRDEIFHPNSTATVIAFKE